MDLISSTIFFVLTFLSVYVQVFFFVTFLENRKKIATRQGRVQLKNYPALTVMVPCWNEEKTIHKTIESLFNLNYPQEKIKIFLIDDGSTDGTWSVLQKFSDHPNVKIFRKENGGKHSALNLGLEHVETEFLACLDADSVADKESVVRLMSYFEENPKLMAVVPSIVVNEPKNIVQSAQIAEYHMSVFMKKMLSTLGAINVTPGPLTIFRKKVFDDLGPYTHAHNTEDMEIAYRMQKNHYLIEHCHDAYVYTNTPHTVKKLFKQRLRWQYGFINNTIDYRSVIFKPKYGYFSSFTLPAGIIAVTSVTFLFLKVLYNIGSFVVSKVSEVQTIGVASSFSFKSFDPFFISLPTFSFVLLVAYALLILAMLVGRKIAEGKWKLSMSMIYYLSIFSILSPLWLAKAVYHTLLFRKKPAWR